MINYFTLLLSKKNTGFFLARFPDSISLNDIQTYQQDIEMQGCFFFLFSFFVFRYWITPVFVTVPAKNTYKISVDYIRSNSSIENAFYTIIIVKITRTLHI